LILVSGALGARSGEASLAGWLASDFTVFTYDRRAGATAATRRSTRSSVRSMTSPPSSSQLAVRPAHTAHRSAPTWRSGQRSAGLRSPN